MTHDTGRSKGSAPRTIGALLLLLLLGTSAVPLSAQQPGEEKEPEPIGFVGIFGGLGFNAHTVSVDPLWLTGGPPASSEDLFVEGSGTGFTAGVLIELPLSGSFGFGARASVQNRDGSMEARYQNTTDVTTTGGAPRPGTINAEVDTRLPYLAVTPHFRVMPRSLPLYFFAGPTLLLPLGPTYDYSESIVDAQGLVFSGTNRTNRARALDRELPGASTKLAVTLGLGAEFFLTDRVALIADAQYSPMIGSISSDLESSDTWRADMTSLTLGLKFGFGRRGSPPPPPPPPPVAVDTATADTAAPGVRAGVLTGTELRDTLVARNQRVQQTDVHALLPYVFFPKDGAEIPARYTRIERRNLKSWREETIDRGSSLDIYYNLLNIIGYRMRRNRKAQLKITGCLGLRELGDSASTLALDRATAVRDYLRDVWRIREDKMEIVTRELPMNPSLSEVDPVRGDIENQRVEFHANDLGILAPVRLPDTLLLQPTGVIRLIPPPSDLPDSLAAAESWEVNVRVGDSLIKRAATGFGPPPEKIDIELDSRPDLNRRGPIEITSELVIIDSTYEERDRIASNPVWFVEEGGFLVDRNIENGMYVDSYSLLLYSFDSAQVFDFSFQAEEILREKIYPESKVTVIGHTDVIGLPYYNKQLSLRRAQTAVNVLQIEGAEVVGAGEKGLLYDNDHPEGRYYSRTVTVIIKTPIPEGETNVIDLEGGDGSPATIETSDEESDGELLDVEVETEEDLDEEDDESEEVPTSVSVPE